MAKLPQLRAHSIAFLTPTTKNAPPAYLAGFNSLRALAALLVCFRHFSSLLPERERVDVFREIASYGPAGVYLFFVVSGYIVPYSLLRQNYQLPDFGAYLKRRFVRLAPPFYVATLLTLVQWVVIDKFVHQGPAYIREVGFGRLLHNLFFTVSFTKYDWVVGTAWTLGVEWQFYLVVGLLFSVFFISKQGGWWFIALYALLGLFSLTIVSGLNFPAFSSLFALGGATLLWQRGRLPLPAYLLSLLLFAGLVFYQLYPWAAAMGLLTVLGILFITRPIPVLTSIGKIAYSFSLTHMLVGRTAEFILYRLLTPTSDAGRTLVLVLCLCLALAFAALFYRWVELPFMRLSKQVHRAS